MKSVLVSLQLSALLVLVLVHFMLTLSPNTVCSKRYDHSWRANDFVYLSCGSQDDRLCQVDIFISILCYATDRLWF